MTEKVYSSENVLRTFAPIVSAHSYYECTFHIMHQARAIGQMAVAIALPGFNDLGRSVTPIFLLMDYFLYQFSRFSEKMKKICRLEVSIFCKMHHAPCTKLHLHSF